MDFSIEKNERYFLMSWKNFPDEKLETEVLIGKIYKLAEDANLYYIIADLRELKSANSELINNLIEMNKFLKNRNGILVVCNGTSNFNFTNEVENIIIVPKLEEAIEYIFMDQLEKELLD